MDHLIIFNCYNNIYIVKYNGDFIRSNVIEEKMAEFYHSDEYNNTTMSDQEVIEKVMASFDNVPFEFIETQYVDAVWCYEQN